MMRISTVSHNKIKSGRFRGPMLAVSSAFILILASGCRKTSDSTTHIAAEQLFNKSLVLLRAYTDSMKSARDSAHVELLARAFDSKINAVNFEFPPDTDLRLTEEENDSLIKLSDRMVEARRKRLKHFARNEKDTITTDSTISRLPDNPDRKIPQN